MLNPKHISIMVLWLFGAGLAAGAETSTTRLPTDYLREQGERLHRFVMDNGLVGLVKEDRSAPVVAVQVWVGTGSIHEEERLGAGMSHYFEHMIFKGTETRGPADITKDINDAGGKINAYTSVDRTVFHTIMPSKAWKVGVEVLADGMQHASFPEEEWAREKNVVVREMVMGRDDPNRILYKLMSRTAFRVHPYRYPVIGYEEIFTKVTRDDLLAFYHRHYVPDNMTVVVAGDVDPREAEAYIREVYGSFERKARAPVIIPEEPPQLAPRYARETGSFEVSRLKWVYHTVPLSHPDAALLDVLSYVTGHGRSSRLTKRLREREQLVFNIDAWSYTPKLAGLFGISATFDPGKEEILLENIEDEVRSWHEELVTEEELEKAKRMLLVGELAALQTMNGQASNYASGEFYAGDPLYGIRYLEKVQSATPQQVRDVARRYLVPDNRTLVVLAPEEEEEAGVDSSAANITTPQVERHVLGNGIPLLVREDHRLPFVNVCVVVRGGLLSETEQNNGITTLMATLLTRGTTTRSAEEIAEQVERLGGSLSPFSGRNSFGIQAFCLAEDIDTFVALARDCLLNPTFPEEELGKERDAQLARIQQRNEDPFQLAMESLRNEVYAGHPYRFTPDGEEESIRSLTREDLQSHLAKMVARDEMVVSIFGDIQAEQAVTLGEAAFAEIPAGTAWAQQEVAAPELPVERIRREPREQAILLVGYPGLDVTDPRVDAMNVVRDALSGLSSDLGIEVREKRGLVYYVGAFQRLGVDPGMFVLYAGTREEAVPEVRQLMGEQLARITGGKLREEEFLRAKEQLIAQHEMSLQDNGGLAQGCALNELYGLGYDYVFGTAVRLNALTLETIKEAATSIFVDETQAVSILLPEIKEEPQEPTS